MIPVLCKQGKVQEAERLFGNALPSGYNPDEGMWTMLIDGLLKDGENDTCLKQLKAMEKKMVLHRMYKHIRH